MYCKDEKFLRDNIIYLNFNKLSLNPTAIEILKENRDKINWVNLSENPAALELLIENPDKINWQHLSSNHNAIDLLLKNPEKINQTYLKLNSSIQSFKLMKDIDWCQMSCREDIFIVKDKTLLIQNALSIILT